VRGACHAWYVQALFNAVPKKDDGKENQKQEELDPDTGPTFTDITQEIEYQRANVVAKTKITDEVFQYGSTLVEGPEQFKNSKWPFSHHQERLSSLLHVLGSLTEELLCSLYRNSLFSS
jgi:hypothetical protein